MNRHKQPLTTFKLQPSEFRKLFPGEYWNVLVGEYMNKSKKDISKKVFNHKFVIFDILVRDSNWLLGVSFEDRWKMLYDMFKDRIISENEYSYQITENIWLVKVFYTEFEKIWNEITKIDMIEGLVLKKRNDVYYEMYREALCKAKMAKEMAVSSYLEAKRIKNIYMLEDLSDTESDEDAGE